MTRLLRAPALALLLAGCAVGPNFHHPAAPAATAYTPDPLPTQAGGQVLQPGAGVSAQWWTAFGSPALDALEDEALRHNPDVESATAALRAARQTYLSQHSVRT